MKRHLLYIILLFVSLITNANPVTDLLERIDRGASKKIAIEIVKGKNATNTKTVPSSAAAASDSLDFFELDQQGNRPLIRANNYISAAVGLNWYLKYYCGIHLSWNCMKATLPTTLPKVTKKERHATRLRLRYDFNYCTFSYSMAFWDWARWQTEIDWMALHGINMPLAAVGHECVWRNMLLRLGYSEEEVGKFIAGPAFLAWWEMNNLEGWGGPLPLTWYKQQEALQKKILRRMKEFGMTPVLPGYSGMRPSFESGSHPSSVTSPSPSGEMSAGQREALATEESSQSSLNKWNGFNRPAVIFPSDKRFDEYARLFYEETKKLYGTAAYYSIDPFHEAKNLPADLNIGESGKAILSAMKNYGNPEAKWVLQGWSENPRDEMLEALPIDEVLVLDLFSECRPQYGDPNSVWYRPEGYRGHNWLFCMLENFGANVGMHGRMDQLLGNYNTALKSYSTRLRGIGLTMEGSETNPIMYELMTELPWRTHPVKKEQWVKRYIAARYGLSLEKKEASKSEKSTRSKSEKSTSSKSEKSTSSKSDKSTRSKSDKSTRSPRFSVEHSLLSAWRILAATIYNCPRGNNQQGPSESIFCSRPSLNSYQASSWSKMVPYYSAKSTMKAARLMAAAADSMQQAYQKGLITDAAWDNFQYDLVDVCRQAIADRARDVYHQTVADFKNFDRRAFRRDSKHFLHLLLLQDSLLATRSEFRVGRWIEQARSLGTTVAEKDQYEWNARVQITTWGNRYCADTGKLRDYAHKEWNGLLKDFYYKRWAHFFSVLQDELDGKLPMAPIDNSSTKTDTNPVFTIDWYAMEEPWTLQHNINSAEAEGSPIEFVKKNLSPASPKKNLSPASPKKNLSPASPKGRSR